MSGVAALALGVGLIALGGVLPARWATRELLRGLLLVLPAGVVVCGTAAGLTLLLPGPFLAWWIVAAVLLAGVAGWFGRGREFRLGPVLPFLAAAATAAFGLTQVRIINVGTDTRYIWLLHARLLSGGHDLLVRGLTNPVLEFSHPDYPQGVPAAVALAWNFSSGYDYRLAQLLIGLLTANAVAALGFELGRLGRGRAGIVISAAAGVLVMLACYGFFRITSANGYMDPIWSALAAAAVVAGLIAPIEDSSRRTAFVLAAAAALTKNDGLPIAATVIVLTWLRYRLAEPVDAPADEPDGAAAPTGLRSRLVRLARPGHSWWAPGLLLGPAVLWLLATRVHHIKNRAKFGEGLSGLLAGKPEVTSRFQPFWTALWDFLPLALWVAVAAVLCGLAFARARRRAGIGGQVWSLLPGVVGIACLVPPYLFDPAEIHWLIDNSIDRTTIFLNLLCLALLAAWPITFARSDLLHTPRPRTED